MKGKTVFRTTSAAEFRETFQKEIEITYDVGTITE